MQRICLAASAGAACCVCAMLPLTRALEQHAVYVVLPLTRALEQHAVYVVLPLTRALEQHAVCVWCYPSPEQAVEACVCAVLPLT